MNLLKKTVLTLLVAVAGFVPAFIPATVSATTPQEAACEGIDLASGEDCSGDGASTSISNLVGTVINILSWIVGIISIIMVIIGGLKFVTANGNAQSAATARSTIIYALIGVVVAAVAQVLVRFVINTATS